MNSHKDIVMNKAVKIIKWTILGIVFVIAFGWVVMLLWNWLIPSIFNLREITFWEALGLLLLGKLLFGGFHGKDRSRNSMRWKQHYYNKFSTMTPEERERFKAKMKEKWCYREKSQNTPSDTSTV